MRSSVAMSDEVARGSVLALVRMTLPGGGMSTSRDTI
jgi:hypothetical protein